MGVRVLEELFDFDSCTPCRDGVDRALLAYRRTPHSLVGSRAITQVRVYLLLAPVQL